MKFGILSGALWALDTTILGIALLMSPFGDSTAAALAFAAIASSALHDILCAMWLTLYMAVKGRLKDTLLAIRSRSGAVVAIGALLGGPIGMSGYVMAIDMLGPAYTAAISAFYPAFGTLLAAIILKERVTFPRMIALGAAVLGVIGMGAGAMSLEGASNPTLGIICALVCVAGWGSEAVFCAWGMRDDAVDNETALHIREMVSGFTYALIVLPVFGAWNFTAEAIPTVGSGVISIAALAGAASYLFYYKAIDVIGAAKGMALNISYSAWAVFFGMIMLGSIPSPWEIVCCIIILLGTICAACDWSDLFDRSTR
mgnify:FL=1